MLLSLAVDHRTTDVATRERFHVAPQRVPALYKTLDADGIQELALFATCNRTELYAWFDHGHARDVDRRFVQLSKRWMPRNTDARALLGVATRRVNAGAAHHAIRVAVGLESQVLGDGQILGQVRSAYRDAAAADATGPVLSRLMEIALRAGKRVQAETLLGGSRTSVGAHAASLAMQRFGALTHTRVVIIGCGKTGERAARAFWKLGTRDLVLINRTAERARVLTDDVGGRSAAYDERYGEIGMADVVVLATGAPKPIVKAKMLDRVRINCASTGNPLLIFDLAVPRNAEPTVRNCAGVKLVDLDALEPEVTAADAKRRGAIPAAEAIVADEVKAFVDWLAEASAREAIRPLHETIMSICRRELAYAASPEVADRVAERIAAKVLARPMLAMRAAISRDEPVSSLTESARQLFSATHRAPTKRGLLSPPTVRSLEA